MNKNYIPMMSKDEKSNLVRELLEKAKKCDNSAACTHLAMLMEKTDKNPNFVEIKDLL